MSVTYEIFNTAIIKKVNIMKQQISLPLVKLQAKEVQKLNKIKYNKALHLVAEKYGYSTYQALLKKVEHDFIEDSDPIIQELKQNFWKNKEVLETLFKRLNNLTDDLENFMDMQDTLSDEIAKLLIGELLYHHAETGLESFYGYSIYTQVSYADYKSDIDSMNADYALSFMTNNLEIFINHRKYDEIDIEIEEGKIKHFKEWLDWEEEYRTITCPQ